MLKIMIMMIVAMILSSLTITMMKIKIIKKIILRRKWIQTSITLKVRINSSSTIVWYVHFYILYASIIYVTSLIGTV